MSVQDLVQQAALSLSAAERRVAEVVVRHPQAVAFGTVAELAHSSGSGAATVVRLAVKLGFDGFSALQAAVQDELTQQLRPAAARIKELARHDVLGRTLQREFSNLQATFDGVDRAAYDRTVEVLATARRVGFLSGDASRGVAIQCVEELAYLRDDVELIDGNPVVVGRQLSRLGTDDLVVAIDLRRYDQWVVDAVGELDRGAVPHVAITDSHLSPLAVASCEVFVVGADAVGPFDSHVATLAFLGALSASVAERLKVSATERLERVEALWSSNGALKLGPA